MSKKQVLRLERTPFGRLFAEQTDDDPDDDHPDGEHKVSAAAIGLMRFNMGMLLASIPKRALAKIAAAAP